MHYLKMESRRRVVGLQPSERVLLLGSRVLGHTARIGRPLMIWMGAAAAIAWLLILVGSGYRAAWFSFDYQFFGLWLDVALSPVTCQL